MFFYFFYKFVHLLRGGAIYSKEETMRRLEMEKEKNIWDSWYEETSLVRNNVFSLIGNPNTSLVQSCKGSI